MKLVALHQNFNDVFAISTSLLTYKSEICLGIYGMVRTHNVVIVHYIAMSSLQISVPCHSPSTYNLRLI